ncbi:MAG: RNA-binding protein [Halobacteriovoraceae bacterium]|nr:RNA-binding protein [Halobacteriovoraceae bacterium]MCB9095233.1 RNA-binding protein [Halobacteriovoraceae bacterium]
MSSKVYVGNISFQMSESDLENLFQEYGTVNSVKIITDRETGRSRGFGFVEMGTPDEAQTAIENLDGKENNGRNLKVNIAQEKPRGGGGGPRSGGFRR